MRAVCARSLIHIFISVESEWSAKYMREKQGRSNDCYNAEVTEDLGAYIYWEVIFR